MLVTGCAVKLEFKVPHCALASPIVADDLDDHLVSRVVLVLNQHTLGGDGGAAPAKNAPYCLLDLEIKMHRCWELIGLVHVNFSAASEQRNPGVSAVHFLIEDVVFGVLWRELRP